MPHIPNLRSSGKCPKCPSCQGARGEPEPMSYLVFVGTKLQSSAQRSLGFSMGRCWSIKDRQGRECISSKSPRATDAAASGSLGKI